MKRNILSSCLLLFITLLLVAQNNNAKFMHLNMGDGLSNNQVNVVYHDSKGFLWVGTQDGLNKYDGYNFTLYRNDADNPNSISGNAVFSIVEDSQGQLWIGTENGLNKFNRETETFVPYNPVNRQAVVWMLVDRKGYLWVGYENALQQLDTKTGELVSLVPERFLPLLRKGTVSCLYEDQAENLWIGIWEGGLVKLDKSRKKGTHFKNNAADATSLPDNSVSSIFQDDNQQLWIGTQSAGLCRYNAENQDFSKIMSVPRQAITAITSIGNHSLWICQGHFMTEMDTRSTERVFHYKNEPCDYKSFTAGFATTMHRDKTGIVWIATGVGISYSDPKSDKYSAYFHGIGAATNDEKYYCKTGCVDNYANVWIGTFGKGLFYYNANKNTFTHYPASQTGLSSDMISSICEVQPNLYWIGTAEGINVFNASSKKVVGQLKHSGTNPNSLFHNVIRKIVQDSRKNIWVVTQEGLDLIRNGTFTHYTKNSLKGLSHYLVTDLLEDKDGNVWIATIAGLNKYDWKKNKITQYNNGTGSKSGLSSSDILSLFEDSKGKLWVSTRNGLNLFDKKTDSFKPYLFNSGVESDIVYKIAEDKQQNLWMLTASGFSKLNTTTAQVTKYDESDGLNLNLESFWTDRQGNFYVGGTHTGIYIFNPKEIKENPVVPPVYITNFTIFNKQVAVEPDNKSAVLQKHISSTHEITLSYDQTVIGFDIAALNFTLPNKNRYAYKLDGFDKEWIYVNAENRRITYTNLSSGTYTLQVKGSNNDGVWNEQAVTLKIVVTPPFWRTNFAYLVYLLLVAVIFFYYRRFTLKRYNENIRVEMEQLQNKKIHEVDQMKVRFFTNISHEFRTPLTLIAGPLEKLMREVQSGSFARERLQEQFSLMHRNTQRLILLVNQILDLQKSETGTLKLSMQFGDVMLFLRSLSDSFLPYAEQKNIQYQCATSREKLETNFDSDKMEKIVSNLLSNAFKFTKDKVELNVKVEADQLIIEVEDNGLGIAKENLSKVFQNFYQVDNSSTRKNEGSGIGLALTYELVQLHKGSITVESEENVRTVFRVVLPIQLSAVGSQQSAVNGQQSTVNSQRSTDGGQGLAVNSDQLAVDAGLVADNSSLVTDKPLVLIVEDNADLRFYIRDVLSDAYQILEAENGKLGVEAAFETMPDLIVSDVMMPEMDGMELCNILKTDDSTSHIPIILLTALSGDESKLKGIKTGADAYVNKPFNAELLLARIENLIETRRRLQLKFQQGIQINPAEITTNVGDEKLLKKAMGLVESNLDNLDFEIQAFIKGMNMSRASLYTKIKAITGQSVSDFIKSIRLKKAAQLLLTKEFTISEICYRVGFQNRTQFNRSFKEHFLVSPTEFIQKNTKQ